MDKKTHTAGGIGSLLVTLAAGAGLMYFYDPKLGDARRKQLRDKVTGLRNDAEQLWDEHGDEVRSRVNLAAGQASRILKRDTELDDATLTMRVKEHLGRHSSNPGAINVMVNDGVVTLHGQVIASEAQRLLRAVGLLHGIARIDNQLQLLDQPQNI